MLSWSAEMPQFTRTTHYSTDEFRGCFAIFGTFLELALCYEYITCGGHNTVYCDVLGPLFVPYTREIPRVLPSCFDKSYLRLFEQTPPCLVEGYAGHSQNVCVVDFWHTVKVVTYNIHMFYVHSFLSEE